MNVSLWHTKIWRLLDRTNLLMIWCGRYYWRIWDDFKHGWINCDVKRRPLAIGQTAGERPLMTRLDHSAGWNSLISVSLQMTWLSWLLSTDFSCLWSPNWLWRPVFHYNEWRSVGVFFSLSVYSWRSVVKVRRPSPFPGRCRRRQLNLTLVFRAYYGRPV